MAKDSRWLSWLHISDVHCRNDDEWDVQSIRKALIKDLEEHRDRREWFPDFVFFTGDLSFGETGKKAHGSIADQFRAGFTFLEQICGVFGLSKDRLFLVPGNHDIDRTKIRQYQQEALLNKDDAFYRKFIQEGEREWDDVMERLSAYRSLLEDNRMVHLLQDPKRLIYSTITDIRGLTVGVAGLNSAFLCHGGDERGKIVTGGGWQAGELGNRVADADVRIALIHHSQEWIREEDGRLIDTRILKRAGFQMYLHGHEHRRGVRNTNEGLVICGYAGYEGPQEARHGFNYAYIDATHCSGGVFLREFDGNDSFRPDIEGAHGNDRGFYPLGEILVLRSREEIRKRAEEALLAVFEIHKSSTADVDVIERSEESAQVALAKAEEATNSGNPVEALDLLDTAKNGPENGQTISEEQFLRAKILFQSEPPETGNALTHFVDAWNSGTEQQKTEVVRFLADNRDHFVRGAARFVQIEGLPAPEELARWIVAASNSGGAMLQIVDPRYGRTMDRFGEFLMEAKLQYTRPVVGLIVVPAFEDNAVWAMVDPSPSEDVLLQTNTGRKEKWRLEENRPVLVV